MILFRLKIRLQLIVGNRHIINRMESNLMKIINIYKFSQCIELCSPMVQCDLSMTSWLKSQPDRLKNVVRDKIWETWSSDSPLDSQSILQTEDTSPYLTVLSWELKLNQPFAHCHLNSRFYCMESNNPMIIFCLFWRRRKLLMFFFAYPVIFYRKLQHQT